MICKHKLTKLNASKYWYILLTSQSIVYVQLKNQTVLFQTIQFRISQLFELSLNVK